MRKGVLILIFLTISLMPIIVAPAPTAETLPAQNITQTSAILRGRVNPNGVATQVDFACCDPSGSPTYFSPTPIQNIGNGVAPVLVTFTLMGLTPGTTYSYAIRASNADGWQNGACVSFTTTMGIPSANLTTNKATYALGETVFFTLTNTGGIPITSNDVNPWAVYKQMGPVWQIAYVPAAMLQPWTLNPGQSKTWSWGQTSNAALTIDAGMYKVEVKIPGVGTWSQTFAIGAPSGTGSLRIYNNISDYKVYIDGSLWYTSSGETAVIHNIPAGVHELTIRKSGCQDIVETITITSGVTTEVHVEMSCGEEDDDNDGVPNSKDHCHNPGCNLVDSRGCPLDTDQDGVNDCEDRCPQEKGGADKDGCPKSDKDGDGVTDDKDACYNPGCTAVDAQGCPKDSDSDGLTDCEDECPQQQGEKRNNGCPAQDADNDGVPDDQDSCYNPGCNRVDQRGCPQDMDNDGLNDCEDNCPGQSGPRDNGGCPKGFCFGSIFLSALFLGLLMKK